MHPGPGSPVSATPPRAQLQPQDGGRSFKTTGRSFMSASRVLTATSTLVKMSQAGELRKIKGRRVQPDKHASSVLAARALNAIGEPRATLSLLQEEF